jgi:RNA polymerase sigma factor FliA
MPLVKEAPGYRNMSETEISRLWADYVECREGPAREAIIHAYSSLARIIAAKLYANRQVQEIEFNDYLHYAFVGLMEAVDRFDPLREVSFQTYAGMRITGAVLSGIEKGCERQQQIALSSRLKKERMQVLQNNADEESAGLSLFEKLADIAIGLAVGYMLEDSNMYQGEEQKMVKGAYEKLEFVQRCDVIRRLVELLPDQQKTVVKHHYFYAYSAEKTGDIIGLSKGRVAQIHKRALGELRLLYKRYGELDRSA